MGKWSHVKAGVLLVVVLGYATLAGAVYFLVANTVFWINAESTSGEVRSWQYMEETDSTRRKRMADSLKGVRIDRAKAVVVSFNNKADEEVVFVTEFGSSMELYSTGDKVTVLYDEADSQNAKIRGFMSMYLGPLLMLLMGAVLWFFGTIGRAFIEPDEKPGRRN